ncbi:MAG: hypothetical protein NC310_01045 [Roseburia sp.]|nr:hypothetical protein [Anaeroplasma bactoclasticum]MCM1195640.1 hypothetical protein [Roseburia sp.]MCM1556615.1 hypothetical protein [Anaeroplasma bactoclasticum]
MRKHNKLFLLCSAGLLALSVVSCKKKEVRNTSVPLGNLNMSAVVATNGDYKLENNLYYSRLRNKGYNTVFNQIKKALFAEEYAYVKSQIDLSDSTVTDEEQDLFDAYASDVFGSSSVSTIKDLEEEDLDTSIQKYIDLADLRGITIKKEDILKKYSTDGEKILFTYIPQDIIDEECISLAQNKATKDALDKIVDEEKIIDDDEKQIVNTNYISEADYSSQYTSNQKSYGTYRAIIIQFNNLNEARNVISSIEKKLGHSLTEDNLDDEFVKKFYVNLYNTYYSYRTPLDPNDPFSNSTDDSKTVFVVNKDKNELSEMSSAISNLVTTTLENDGDYIKRPFNQNNKYVMIYRGKTEFELNKTYNITPYNEQIEWNDLKENETAFKEIKAELRQNLIENKINSYSSTVLLKRIQNSEIEIYDPYFEYQFKNSYSDDYELISPSKFNNNLIFKLTYTNPDTKSTNTKEYTVEDFYNEQTKLSGLNIVVEHFKLEYVYNFKNVLLEDDRISDIEEELNKAITSFNKDENTAYPSSVGLETYLLGTYGYSTKEDTLKYNKIASSAVLNAYLSHNVFDEWALKQEDGTYPESHTVDSTKLNILKNILNAGNNNYKNLFSINIDHILIFIDDDGDGSPDDPKDFLRNFTETQKEEFNTALLALANAIYDEANCEELTKSNSILDILKYIVGAYNRNDPLFSHPDQTWEAYKKYNFLLTAESLSSNGDTTQSNVDTYVEEFGAYVKELYNKAVENDIKIDDKKSIFYFTESLNEHPSKIEDLCATQFGYHMIVVNSYTKPSTTKSLESSDQYGYYKNIEILLNEKDADTTDDNIYVIIPDTYNELENEATMNQLFVYYVQKQKNVTSSLDSSLRTVLSSMFDEAITRYTSTDFQNYLLFNELNIDTDSAALKQQLTNYKAYLKRTSQSYSTKDDFETWYDDSLDWSRPYDN